MNVSFFPSSNRRRRTLALSLVALIGVAGCQSLNRAEGGGAIGAGAGGILGGIIGKASGNTTAGVLIGAVVGGAAGASIGHYMDKQAAELQQDLKGAKVERVGEGIKITFDTGILFDVNKSDLRSEAKNNIDQLAKTLQKYNDTNILVQGHTDNTGSADYNQKLSEARAMSVSRELKTDGVMGGRIDVEGMGEAQPVADNATEAGRQANRRVEVAITANQKLKKAAEQGRIG